jgi:hypothetical protein
MKKFAFALLAMATALAITPSALGDSISGQIGINGSSDKWTVSQVSFSNKSPSNATVAGSPATGGSLASLIGDTVTFPTNPLVFSTADGKEMFSVEGGLATLTINTLVVDYDTALALILNGTGTLTETGYAPTAATWSLSSTKTGGTTFGIDATTPTVPEPSSLLLLGTGLLGLAVVVFRKAAKSSGLVLHS